MLKMSSIFKHTLPWVLYLSALILAAYMGLSSNFVNNKIINPIFGNHIQVSSSSASISKGQLHFKDNAINNGDYVLGKIDRIRITPELKGLLSGHHKRVTLSGGNFSLRFSEFTDLSKIIGLMDNLNANPAEFIIEKLKLHIGEENFILWGGQKYYQLANRHHEIISVKFEDEHTKIKSSYWTLPYISLRNIEGIITQKGDHLNGTIKANLDDYKSELDIKFKLSPHLYKAQGVTLNSNGRTGEFSATYAPQIHDGSITSNIHNLNLITIHNLIPWVSDIQGLEIEGGKAQLLAKLNIHQDSLNGQVRLNWKDGTAKLFFYDITGITADLPIITAEQSNNVIIKAKSIRRHRLNFTNVSIVGETDSSLGMIPKIIDIEFCKGQLHLHDFKLMPEGLLAKVDFSDLDINEMISTSDVTTLAATGTISGSAVVLLDQSTIKIITMSARSSAFNGKIHYLPSDKEEEEDKNEQALSDLNYTVLNISLQASETDNNPGKIKIHIVGTNPEVSNGYPLDFTIETEGNFSDFF
ncbi:intermembrane phospholipid transport protein YdbH family protein [Candidatus Odyssella acanthamoebae]|nr:YdbH domain-containing protein [Candidatus Paracaedibacter acanthamoebae]